MTPDELFGVLQMATVVIAFLVMLMIFLHLSIQREEKAGK
jgi:hypothetical protein